MRWFIAAVAAFVLASQAGAQGTWPQRPVTLVVPFGAGGSADLTARVIAPHLQAKFGQPFVIDNKGGAGGSIGAGFVAKAANDGYTLLVGTISSNAINAALYTRLSYDLDRDFQPVSRLVLFPNLMMVNTEAAGALGARADRLSQGQSRQGELRLVGHRDLVASLGGDVRARDRDRDDPHPVPQHERGRQQHDRRQHRSRHRFDDDDHSLRAVRRGARARGDDAAAQSLDARTCRPSGRRCLDTRRRHGRACSRRPGRRGRSSTGSPRQ